MVGYRTAREVAGAIRAKEVSPIEVLDASLARIDEVNPQLNAVIWRDDDQARKAAKQAGEEVVRTGQYALAPFHGVPLPIKDLTPVAGWPVTYGSWAGPQGPSAESALVVDAFRRAAFVLAGRTNTPEFGPITAAENDRYGITRNPWDLDRTPGGSSGGAAAAVASGMYPLAHANDGGGSIRIPASCCGLVGLKVSRGRVPASYTPWEGGAVEGVVTLDVGDTAAVLDVIAGPDPGCWYNAPVPERPFVQEVGRDPGRLRVGLVQRPPFGLPLDQACAEAVRVAGAELEALGHLVDTVEWELPEPLTAAFLNVVNSGLADYDDIDWDRAEPHIRAYRNLAQEVDSLTYVRSVHEPQRFSRGIVARWGAEFDVLATPTMTIEPPPAGRVLEAVHANERGSAIEVFQMAVLTSTFNITGQPAISLPMHWSQAGLPIGVQLVAGPWEEDVLIRVASQLEAACGWRERTPAI